MNEKITKEELLAGGITLPSKDSRCDICKLIRKNKTLSYVNGKWVCDKMECHNKAMVVEK